MSYDISNDIYIGSLGASALFHFTNADIVLNSMKGIFNVDLIGNELPVDNFTVTIRYDPSDTTRLIYGTSDGDDYLTSNDEEYLLKRITARDFLMSVPYGTVVWWYCDGTLRAKGYASEITRVGKYAYRLKCISGAGLLADKIHVGGLYSGETFGAVCAEIVDGTFAYTISANVAAVRVYGHLPYDSARNNLHRLLFSAGAVLIRKNEYEDYNIQFLGQNLLPIPDSRVALGGSVSYELPSNRAEITEHGFFQTPGDEEVVLYDNSGEQTVDNLTVLFQQAPAYSVTASGNLTIEELSVNHAIVSGTGTLTGKIYTHTRQIYALSENPQNNPERTRRVTDNELVNTLNSRFVAQRILAYYMRSRIIKSKILLQTEVPGSYVQMNDAYGDPLQGYIQQMEFAPTSLKAANCQIAEGFSTDAYGNTFTRRQIFTYSQYGSDYVRVQLNFDRGKTTVVRLVLIGAGDGGQAGYDGEDGGSPSGEVDPIRDDSAPREYEDDHEWEMYAMVSNYENDINPAPQPTPQGGAAGQPGSPGKIYVYDVDVSFLTPSQPASLVMSLYLGTPGDGGASDGAIGSSGGETVVGVAQPLPDGTRPVVWLSSADGVQIDNGWSDIMTGDVYLLPGADGIRGGNGGRVDTVSDKGQADFSGLVPYARRMNTANPIRGIGAHGLPGESVQNGNGGAGGDGYGYDGTILEWREPNAGGYTVHQWFKGYNYEAERYAPWHTTGATGAAGAVLYPQAASGGGGGGGAYGANGSPGASPVMENHGGDIFTGNGGNGANALPPPDVAIGCGGNGGNGGGAGGNGGGGYTYGAYLNAAWYGIVNYATQSGTVGGQGGQGGAGSRGGRGGDGALIIYY